jgi:hypothetical protein
VSSDDRKTPGDDDAGGDAPKPARDAATDAPKLDAPKLDAPKPDAPKPDAPKLDAPKPDSEGLVLAPTAGERMDLPKWNRARVKRAPAKTEGAAGETDAFQQGVREAGRAAVRRVPLVVLGVLGLAAAIGGVIWFSRLGV